MSAVQLNLLEPPPEHCLPEGFAYEPELISRHDEAALVARFAALPFREFEFRGYFGKRRVVSFGLRYDYVERELHRAEPIPEFLLPLRNTAAAFAGLAPEAIEHALVTEYMPGAPIGWHRDRPVFGDIIGVSFLSPCRFRFRRPLPNLPPHTAEGSVGVVRGQAWERTAVTLAPRSAYLMRGPARDEWEHSIPPAEALRYSVTFRPMRGR